MHACDTCPNRCDAIREAAETVDPGAFFQRGSCVLGRWEEGMRGAGDVVHAIASPVAKALKLATGGRVDLTSCSGCESRRDALNRLMPFPRDG